MMIGTPANIATKTPKRGNASRERKSADEKETADKNGAAGQGVAILVHYVKKRKIGRWFWGVAALFVALQPLFFRSR